MLHSSRQTETETGSRLPQMNPPTNSDCIIMNASEMSGTKTAPQTTSVFNGVSSTTSPSSQSCPAKKAQDFYAFFRSGNNHEVETNLARIASNLDLDKYDLSLLNLMLRNIPQTHLRRLVQTQSGCAPALQRILETVRENEERGGQQPWQHDVDQVERLIYSPPLSPDVP